MQNYFTELEAAQAAGVSNETIREFTSIGLLKEQLQGEKKVYSRGNLESVFQNIKEPQQVEIAPIEAEKITSPVPAAQDHAKNESPSQTVDAHNTEPLTAQIEVQRGDSAEPSIVDNRSFEVMELNQSLREQIQLLREERDWLRKRVENLEVRGERDQMLLISESRTVQTLLPAPKRKWLTLSWFKKEQ